MDIMCRKCGEPLDQDELHFAAAEQGRTYEEVAADFRTRGCKAVNEDYACEPADVPAEIGTAYDLLGDDLDGAAGTLEDMGF